MRAKVLKNKINSILIDNEYDRYVSNRSRGTLDFENLSKINYSEKIFKTKEARKNKKYNFIFLLDASGSMGNTVSGTSSSRRGVVANSIYDILKELKNTDIDVTVYSYNAYVQEIYSSSKTNCEEAKKTYLYHSDEAMIAHCDTCQYKKPMEKKGERCEDCGSKMIEFYATGDNADGLALHLAREKALTLKGTTVIIMLSDGEADVVGYPNYKYLRNGVPIKNFALKKVVEKVKKDKDIILCSIGINCNAVYEYYPRYNTIVANTKEEINSALFNLIKKQIKRG